MPEIESDTSLAYWLIFVLCLKENFERKAKLCEIPVDNDIFFTSSEMEKIFMFSSCVTSKCVCVYIERDKNTHCYVFR